MTCSSLWIVLLCSAEICLMGLLLYQKRPRYIDLLSTRILACQRERALDTRTRKARHCIFFFTAAMVDLKCDMINHTTLWNRRVRGVCPLPNEFVKRNLSVSHEAHWIVSLVWIPRDFFYFQSTDHFCDTPTTQPS